MELEKDMLKIQSVIQSCISEEQIFTVIDWIHRMKISDMKERYLIDEAQRKFEELIGELHVTI